MIELTKGILKGTRARVALAGYGTETANKSIQCLRVRAGGLDFVLDASEVIYTVKAARPGGDSLADGSLDPTKTEPISYSQGGEIAVFRLADLLRLPDSPEERPGQTIVLKSEDGPWSIWVDHVSESRSLSLEDILPLPRRVEGGWMLPFKGLVPRWVEEPKLDFSVADKLGDEYLDDLGHRTHPYTHFKPKTKLPNSIAPKTKLPKTKVEAESKDEGDHWLLLDPKRLHPSSEIEITEAIEDDPFDGIMVPLRGDSARRQILMFKVSPDRGNVQNSPWLAVSCSQIVEIVETCRRITVPLAASHVLGVLVWRGWPTAAVDLAARLGLPRGLTKGKHRWIITRDTGGRLLAFPTSATMRSSFLPIACDPYLAPSFIDSRRLKGSFVWEKQLLLVPDLDKIA